MAVDKYFQRYYSEKVFPFYSSGDYNKMWNYLDTSTYKPGGAYYLYVGRNGDVKVDTRDIYNYDGTRDNADYLYYDKLAYEQMQSGNLDSSVMQRVINNQQGFHADYYSTVNPWVEADARLKRRGRGSKRSRSPRSRPV